MIWFRLLLCLLGLLWILSAPAAETTNAEFLVKSWQNEDGLPHSIINTILQTHDGYLWIGTYVGLVRFDGERFVQYSARDVPDLETGEIIYLFEDRDDTLWVALQNGRLLAWKEGAVRVVLPGSATNQPVVCMAQQANGALWLQTADGALGRVATNGVTFVSPGGRSASRRSSGLVVDAADHLWVNTGGGLKLWRDGKFAAIGLPALAGKAVEDMTRSQDRAVWAFYNRRLYKIQPGKMLATLAAPEALQDEATMRETSDGCLWIGSSEGNLFYRQPDADGWQSISQTGFRGLNRVLYEDREGNLWRGGFGSGLTRIRPRIFKLHELPETALDRYARLVCADQKGNVWAVLNDQVLSWIPAGSQMPEAVMNSNIRYGIKTLFVDHLGSLWVGTDWGRLYYLKNGTYGQPFVLKLDLGNTIDYINAACEDAEGNLWIGYTGGDGVAVLPKGDAAHWQPVKGLEYPDVRTIAQASDGAMWLGTHYGGVFRWQNGQWTRWTMRDGLPSNYIRCLLAEPDGTIWIGTLHGLCRWRNGKLVAITSENGLGNDSISYLAADDRGNFWITSFGGIFRVSRADLNRFADGQNKDIHCVRYDRDDGLPGVECPGGVQAAGAKTPDGRLWFPTVGGLVSVDPQHLRENRLPPPVWIESLTIDGKSNPVRHSTKQVVVSPGKRRLDFRFTALSFTSLENVFFRHKLDGLETDWSPADNQRFVAYNYLPPGHYTFQLAACNSDGVWNWQGQTLELIVQPFVWQTWWFKTLAGLLLLAAVAWGVRRRERWKARLRFEKLERAHAVEHERSRIAKDIHDDLGANLTQIVFLSQRVESVRREPSEVERWIRKIPAAASHAIQSLDEIVWAINPRHDSLESLANYFSRFAHEFLTLAGVHCRLEVPTVLPPLPLSAEVRHNLILTAREALQNAVTHAGATEVKVVLQLNADGLEIVIADNGVGFDPANVAKPGNGLSNMRKRMENIGGVLEIRSQPRAGATVLLKLPPHRLNQPETGK
jgi:ligand-binding sensor domain-containing protein/signal transduction histidine kinase